MSAFANLRQLSGRALRWPTEYFRAEWERMAPRTRKLLVALMTAVFSLIILMGGYLSFSSISDLEDENALIREALTEITKHHDEYLEAKTRNAVAEQRIGNDPPQLTADLDDHIVAGSTQTMRRDAPCDVIILERRNRFFF